VNTTYSAGSNGDRTPEDSIPITEKLQKIQTQDKIALLAAKLSLVILTLTLHWFTKKTINLKQRLPRNINLELAWVSPRNLQLGNIDPEVIKVTISISATIYQPTNMQFNNIPFF